MSRRKWVAAAVLVLLLALAGFGVNFWGATRKKGIVTVTASQRKGHDPTEEQKERKNECMISSRSHDGVGHQMEAKLTCIATAAALGLSYVHIPIASAEHVGSDESQAAERMFGLEEKFPKFSKRTMLPRKRKPQPWVGHCNKGSWFDEDTRPKNCPPGVLYYNDNCFDFFYCALLQRDKNYTEQMVEALQGLHGADGGGNRWGNGDGNGVNGRYDKNKNKPLTIAVHIRQTDGKRLPIAFFAGVIRGFKEVVPDAVVRVHSDGSLDQGELPGHVVVRDEGTMGLVETLEELIGADILVASHSSLSYTAALYNLGRPVVSKRPKRRKGVNNLPGWFVLDDEKQQQQREFYESVVAEAIAWRTRQRER